MFKRKKYYEVEVTGKDRGKISTWKTFASKESIERSKVNAPSWFKMKKTGKTKKSFGIGYL